jgi:DMSO/TMAO reductase YedYZ heme-binding membrane subunit
MFFWIKLFGMLTFISLLATMSAGIMKAPLKIHRILALLTIVFALVHVGLIVLFVK